MRDITAFARPNSAMRTILAASVFTLASTWAMAGERLTEAVAVQTALSRESLRDAGEGAVDASRAEADEAGLWPNPTFEYERDRTGGQGGATVQNTYRLSQPVDISGRRGLRQDAAGRRLDATVEETQQRRGEAAAEARRAFYTLVLRMQQREAAAAWSKKLVEAEGVLNKLVRGREVSGYDAKRLTRERIAAEVKVRAASAEMNAAWERLRAFLTLPVGTGMTDVEGALPPPPSLGLEDYLSRLDQRHDLLAIRARASASEIEQRAADRGWIPELTVGAGLKQVTQAEREDQGVLLSVSAPLPLFDRGQVASRKAAAQTRATMGDFRLARDKAEGEIRGLWRQSTELREAARHFRESSVAPSRELSKIAEGAYRAGEMGILELLDAYKSQLEAETTALDLEFNAREAHIALTLAAGELPQ
ncbi:MAG: TolC family protein [Magnetospirillum sp.]|nr:MAG: TolC family protein [Magnetospirillum sp.]